MKEGKEAGREWWGDKYLIEEKEEEEEEKEKKKAKTDGFNLNHEGMEYYQTTCGGM